MVPRATKSHVSEAHEPAIGELRSLVIAGRRVTPTPVFSTYWRFAVERQAVFMARRAGASGPWTSDPILDGFRFTNVYRATDRVSQYLLREVLYSGENRNELDTLFRTLLFKMFNRISTWEALRSELGEPTWADYSFERYVEVLSKAANGGPIYSPAYVIPPPKFGENTKFKNHLRLLERIVGAPKSENPAFASGLRDAFERLVAFPSLGPFLAFQFSVDLNYSELIGADEDEFVVAGPGARDGILKCFGPSARGIEEAVIRHVTENQTEYFSMLGLSFQGLHGRPLHLIDCQNLFCEVDKYSRVAHPEIVARSGRTRIKQRFKPVGNLDPEFFPPSWGLTPELV